MISDKELEQASEKLGIESKLLKSVVIVECGSLSGNLDSGKPKILFEGHVFYKLIKSKYGSNTAQRYGELYPTLCYPNFTTKYYQGGEKEYERYYQAYDIDSGIASQSCSWGLGQIMGFNYRECKCSTIEEFVQRNNESEAQQLELWINFLENSGLIKALRDKDWEKFARGYNGPANVEYYSTKLRKTYETA